MRHKTIIEGVIEMTLRAAKMPKADRAKELEEIEIWAMNQLTRSNADD